MFKLLLFDNTISRGYHAENYKECLGIFIKIYLINILIISFTITKNLEEIILILTCISYLEIWKLAPIDHRNNPLSNKEGKHYKRIDSKNFYKYSFL